MSAKKQTEVKMPEQTNVENIEKKNEEYVSILPNWENTKTWLMVCTQGIEGYEKQHKVSNLLNKVNKEKSEKEKFALISEYCKLKKEFYESIHEVAFYETSICMKKEFHKEGEQ